MRDILLFVAGSFYTFFVLAAGIAIGYFHGAREEKLEKRRKQLKRLKLKIRNRGQESGTVKPRQVTQAEADKQEREPFEERFEEIVGPNPPDNTIGFLSD